jgi:ornithine cyclodeaminase
MIILNANEVRQSLQMPETIEAMKIAFSAFSRGQAEVPIRCRLEVPPYKGTSLFMPAFVSGDNQALSLKVVSIFPDNSTWRLPTIHAAVIVLEAKTGRILALLEGSSLTAIRTGAASGAATDLLARMDAKTVTIYGAGVQGRTQLDAVCSVRHIKSAAIVDPDQEKAKLFAKEMSGQGKIPYDLRVMTNPDDAARYADIICTATTSHEPVYSANAVRPGTHINGVGSYTLNMVENPPEIYNQAIAFIDSRKAALAEAGETVKAIEKKLLHIEDLVEIGEVCIGKHPGRISDQQITFFKSVGIAVQDAIAAQLTLKNAEEKGLGKTVSF